MIKDGTQAIRENYFSPLGSRRYDYSTRDQAFFLDTWNKLDVTETSGKSHFRSADPRL